MRINALETFEPRRTAATCVLSSSESLLGLPRWLDGADFYFPHVLPAALDDANLVLAGLNANELQRILSSYGTTFSFEYWLPLNSLDTLRGIENIAHSFAISGVCMSDGWLALRIEGANKNSTPIGGFVEGIVLGFGAGQAKYLQNHAEIDTQVPDGSVEKRDDNQQVPVREDNWREAIIQKLIPIAKPIKPYLPGRVVYILYKILERIR